MPNWCYGCINAKGSPENLRKFCELFIFEDEQGNKKGKYFARSFIQENKESFMKDIKGKSDIDFSAEFAWSCWSCIFEGYPEQYKESGAVTLEWACKEYDIKVLIDTEGWGECFEESISGSKEGVVYNLKNMPEYKCLKCGNIQSMPTDYDFYNEECCECEEIGKFKPVEECEK